MTYYVGDQENSALVGTNSSRYYYALRRTEDGELYFTRVDQLIGDDEIVINNIGLAEDDYTEFEIGVDYFDGRSVEHTRPNANISPDQYRWDSRSIYYYINAEGELVARVNKAYTYNPNV